MSAEMPGWTGSRRSRIETGEVLSMGPDAIHSVELGSPEASYAIHVYLGNLTNIERTLVRLGVDGHLSVHPRKNISNC